MSFLVRIDYTRTGDKATQKPSEVHSGLTWVEAMQAADFREPEPDFRSVVIERQS